MNQLANTNWLEKDLWEAGQPTATAEARELLLPRLMSGDVEV